MRKKVLVLIIFTDYLTKYLMIYQLVIESYFHFPKISELQRSIFLSLQSPIQNFRTHVSIDRKSLFTLNV